MAHRTANRWRRRGRRRGIRRGATFVEMAIVLLVFLTVVLGMLDLGIGVYRSHVLAHAASQCARQAIVHGNLAARLGPWGPTAYSEKANHTHPIADVIRPLMSGLDPADVDILVTWPDGGNDVEQRVSVTRLGQWKREPSIISRTALSVMAPEVKDLALPLRKTSSLMRMPWS